MNASVKSVVPASVAEVAGIAPGDTILSINGNNQLEDLFDYEFEVLGEDVVTLEVARSDGTRQTVKIQKDPMADLGIHFESPIFTPIKTCNNACPFCFIDQQPEGLRPSLYVKDDDYRLSYFCSTYITLTNLTRHDRERISRIRPGPLYVSVHCTVPEIRQQLLVNPKAGDIMKELRWLASLEIPFHAQLVINPGINDGEAFSQSLKDLASLRPHCLSVAVVPVGLTQHRADLPQLRPMDADTATDILKRLAAFEAESGLKTFAFASDEFYVLAGQPIPAYETYGDFPQLEDGVGAARLLTQEFFQLEPTLPKSVSPERKHIALTGKLGQMVLTPIIQRLNQIDGLYVDLVTVENNFWGDAVTVAGLITGQDILNTLGPEDLSGYTSILIPATMLKSGESVLLDDMSVEALSQQLGCPVWVVQDPNRAQSLLDVLFTGPGALIRA